MSSKQKPNHQVSEERQKHLEKKAGPTRSVSPAKQLLTDSLRPMLSGLLRRHQVLRLELRWHKDTDHSVEPQTHDDVQEERQE